MHRCMDNYNVLFLSDFVKFYFWLQQFRFSNFQLTSIKAKSRTLLKLTSKWRKLMTKLIMVSTVNSKTLDSPKRFTKLIFPESKLINQIRKTYVSVFKKEEC